MSFFLLKKIYIFTEQCALFEYMARAFLILNPELNLFVFQPFGTKSKTDFIIGVHKVVWKRG
jgi:hypothetical protein